MTLSARIAVGPSRRLLVATAGLSSGGVLAAATTLVARWPDAAVAIAVFAATVAAALVARRTRIHRRTGPCTLTWSEHADIAVHGPAIQAQTGWRLAPPTMTWSGGGIGLSVLALRPLDRAVPALVLPVLDAELTSHERRQWNRRLMWALRGGDASPRGTDGDSTEGSHGRSTGPAAERCPFGGRGPDAPARA